MDQFKEVDYVQTFRALKLRYEQQLDRMNNKTPVMSDGYDTLIFPVAKFLTFFASVSDLPLPVCNRTTSEQGEIKEKWMRMRRPGSMRTMT